MKTPGIPFWITIVLSLIVILSIVAGGLALFGQGMESFMGASWGGRNLGLGLASLVAILMRSPITYIAVFVASVAREIGDIVQLSQGSNPDWPVVGFAAVLLIVWIIGIVKANQARIRTNVG